MVTSCTQDRFDQKDFEMYATCALLLATCALLLAKSANKEDYSAELEIITDFYGDDFKRNDLDSQLKTILFIISNG